jgi:hypothetical protein
MIEDRLADMMLEGRITEDSRIGVSVLDGDLSLVPEESRPISEES